MRALPLPSLTLFLSLSLVMLTLLGRGEEAATLPGTEPLRREGDLSVQMVEGIQRWLERETGKAVAERQQKWEAALAGAGGEAFLEEKRKVLRAMLGIGEGRGAMSQSQVDPRLRVGLLVEPGAERGPVRDIRWRIYEGVTCAGRLFTPAGVPRALVVILPDATGAYPECISRLVQGGCEVLVPQLLTTSYELSGSAVLNRYTNVPAREWVYRQFFELGRTPIGFEVQAVEAAVLALNWEATQAKRPERPVFLAGFGDGALTALCAGALRNYDGLLLAGYFGSHEQLWREPLWRNRFGWLREFDDAELLSLVRGAPVLIQSGGARAIEGPLAPRAGRAGVAAPGVARPPGVEETQREYERGAYLAGLLPAKLRPAPQLLPAFRDERPEETAEAILKALKLAVPSEPAPRLARTAPEPETFAPPDTGEAGEPEHLVTMLDEYTERLIEEQERGRHQAVWKQTAPGEKWEHARAELRERLWQSIGRLPGERPASGVRSRRLQETEKWVAWEVTLEVRPEIFAWGWLLLPKDLQPGEKRPVVVCQHGLEGLPRDVVTTDEKDPGFRSYQGFASRLADQGYIVYAPHNPYRGHDRFREIQRRANPLGWSLFSFIIEQHEVATAWLAGLPQVDPERIAFYGLSYGGKTAMRVPALVDRYCLSICSGDFNEWIRKVASPKYPSSYLYTGEYEIDEWDLANHANYAEMAMLICPRPFMVERGHLDGVGVDEWVGYEYAKVRRGYDQLGVGERTEIEWFNGPHTIHGVGTFAFLRKHLRWPARP